MMPYHHNRLPGSTQAGGMGERAYNPIPDLINVGGTIAAGAIANKGVRDQNKANALEAQKNRNFQERMSSSSYQRAVEDMSLSGINPMLAYMQGGASSPGGSTARMEDVLGPAVSSAMHLVRFKREMKLVDAQTRDTDSANWLKRSQSNLVDTQNTRELYGVGDGSNPSFIAQRNRLQAELIREQLTALRVSPFGTRFTGTAIPSHLRLNFNRTMRERNR